MKYSIFIIDASEITIEERELLYVRIKDRVMRTYLNILAGTLTSR